MPPPRRRGGSQGAAADALIAVAPLVSRWIERLLAGHEPPLTQTQFLALCAIADEGASGSELARRAGVSSPAVSQLVGGLVDAGLLDRAAVPDDRRRVTLTLTADGRRAVVSAQTLLRRRLSVLLSSLSRPEADALAAALTRVAGSLSGAPPPRRPPPPPRRLPPPPRQSPPRSPRRPAR